MVFGSKLILRKLEVHDKGYYRCEVENGKDTVVSTAILIVKPGE